MVEIEREEREQEEENIWSVNYQIFLKFDEKIITYTSSLKSVRINLKNLHLVT